MRSMSTKRNRLTLLEVLLCGLDELQSSELEAALFEPRDDLADEVALDAVGLVTRQLDEKLKIQHADLDHDVGAFINRHGE